MRAPTGNRRACQRRSWLNAEDCNSCEHEAGVDRFELSDGDRRKDEPRHSIAHQHADEERDCGEVELPRAHVADQETRRRNEHDDKRLFEERRGAPGDRPLQPGIACSQKRDPRA